jgi:radical SAM protein with 4Fe4S-binding SPASM domain
MMTNDFLSTIEIQDFALWKKTEQNHIPLLFDIEITARCNNNCRHCYINLPANDHTASGQELTREDIAHIADQAIELGAMWCVLTGGEPLLRDDFIDIYLMLKRKGLLVSIFTNATLIRAEHVAIFKKYPPRNIEVTVYGASQKSYERVTRSPGSFASFMHGLERLIDADVPVRLKAMALRSNYEDMETIANFARSRTQDYYRFDPQLHLRYDGDERRNEEIKLERLTPEEIVALERSDEERSDALRKSCEKLLNKDLIRVHSDHLFHCGTGNGSFSISYDGQFRLCSSLWAPETLYDLRQGTLREAWEQHVTKVRDLRSNRKEFLEKCRKCELINLCLWCPAHAHLETGEMDKPVDYFCEVAHARAKALHAKR